MTETVDIRTKTRRVKQHILDKFLVLAEKDSMGAWANKDEYQMYRELLLTFARNVVPRTNEITGEDGEAVQIKLVSYADNTGVIPTTPISDTITSSV